MLLCSILSLPVWIGSSRLHWTSTGTDPNGYTLESDSKLVRIADHTGTDPTGPVQTEGLSLSAMIVDELQYMKTRLWCELNAISTNSMQHAHLRYAS